MRDIAPFPVTYGECRARFLDAAADAGIVTTAHLLAALGPAGESLAIDVAHVGAERPRRAMVIMSGVHGVEGPPGSTLQTDLLSRVPTPASDEALVLIHGVNPWGMAWWRRQNEGNVDLNRNWNATPGRIHNPAYAELHDLLCPLVDHMPEGDPFVAELVALGERHGLPWMRRAISSGQDSHPDGLYFAGHEEQASTRILRSIAQERLLDVDDLFIVDLHTGHGKWGTATILSRAAAGTDDDRWLRETFDGFPLEIGGDGTDGQVVAKSGQLSIGLEDLIGASTTRSVTFELGDRDDRRRKGRTLGAPSRHAGRSRPRGGSPASPAMQRTNRPRMAAGRARSRTACVRSGDRRVLRLSGSDRQWIVHAVDERQVLDRVAQQLGRERLLRIAGGDVARGRQVLRNAE